MGFGGPHSRAIACSMCGDMFFPASLKFHEKACVLKQAAFELPCPTCDKVFLRCAPPHTRGRGSGTPWLAA
jgi:ribosomal protein S27E